MKPRRIVTAALLTATVLMLSARAAFADPDKDADLAAKVQQLEKRVAALEEAIKKLSPATDAPTETERKLLGSWVLAEADKDYPVFTDMNLNDKGACVVEDPKVGTLRGYTFEVTGMTIDFEDRRTGVVRYQNDWKFHIASVTHEELVLEVKKSTAS
jgi:hypothetical protein